MTQAATKFIVDVTKPVSVLEITKGTLLDNEYYMFCSDGTTDETGRFLEDNELTYDEFDMGPEFVLPAGTKVILPYVWGYNGDGNMSDPVDYEVTLDKAAKVERVVYVLLSAYHAQLSAMGSEAGGRFYYIEQVSRNADGDVEICVGT